MQKVPTRSKRPPNGVCVSAFFLPHRRRQRNVNENWISEKSAPKRQAAKWFSRACEWNTQSPWGEFVDDLCEFHMARVHRKRCHCCSRSAVRSHRSHSYAYPTDTENNALIGQRHKATSKLVRECVRLWQTPTDTRPDRTKEGADACSGAARNEQRRYRFRLSPRIIITSHVNAE